MATTLTQELANFGANVTASFKPDSLKRGPVHLIHAIASAAGFIVILVVLYFVGKMLLKKVSGLPEDEPIRYTIPIYGGSQLDRMQATGDNALLQWDHPATKSGFSYDKSGYGDYSASINSTFSNREPPFFSETSNDNLRSEDRQQEAVSALSKINAERARRKPDDPYSPLPWAPFWSEWQKSHEDAYLSGTNYEDARSRVSGLPEGAPSWISGMTAGVGMLEAPSFMNT